VHPRTVNAVAFAPNGHHLATAQLGGLIRLWALPAANRDYRVPVGAWSFLRLSRDGHFLLPTGLSHWTCELRSTQVVDLRTGQYVGPPLPANGIMTLPVLDASTVGLGGSPLGQGPFLASSAHLLGLTGLILDAAFSPDRLQVAVAVSRAASTKERKDQPGQQPGQLQLWDWPAGKLRHELPLPSEPRSLDYSPDGQRLALIDAKGKLVVMDPASGKTLWHRLVPLPNWTNGTLPNHYWRNWNGAVRFSPDNRLLLTLAARSVCVWDAFTGHLLHELDYKRCEDVQFSPDGRLVAVAGLDNRLYVCEAATGKQLAALDHPDATETAQFSPDGQHLLTGGHDGMARLWDWGVDQQHPKFTLEHEHEVLVVAFTPDGRYLLSGSADGVLKIWQRRTGKPVCPPFSLGGAGLSLAVTPDGKRVAVGGFLKDLPVFQLDDWFTPSPLGPDDLCLWGEIVSGQRIEAGGGVTNLTAEEWLERWRDFRRRHPEYGSLKLGEPVTR
jgi:WD40 repeat protein